MKSLLLAAFLATNREILQITHWLAGVEGFEPRPSHFALKTAGNQAQKEHCYTRQPPKRRPLRSPRRAWGRGRAADVAATISGDFRDKSQESLSETRKELTPTDNFAFRTATKNQANWLRLVPS